MGREGKFHMPRFPRPHFPRHGRGKMLVSYTYKQDAVNICLTSLGYINGPSTYVSPLSYLNLEIKFEGPNVFR